MFLQPWMQNRVEQWKAQYLSKSADAVIFAEGDSWFDYPFMEDRYPILSPSNYDLLSNVAKDFVVTSTARHGDEISQITSEDQVNFDIATVKKVKSIKGRFVAALISGGGNDIVGSNGNHFAQILKAGQHPTPKDYIQFDDQGETLGLTSRLDAIMRCYRKYLQFVEKYIGAVPVIGHTYDYPYPNGKTYKLGNIIDACGPWFKNHFDEKGTPDADRKAVIIILINAFAEQLQLLEKQYPNFHAVDLRGLIQNETLWQNEMHATSDGYKILSKPYVSAIRKYAMA